jgi:5-methylcytosine-specific restriction enzyme A
MTTENYVYKKEVDWSLLNEGLTLPFDNQVVFGQIMGRFLKRGESKDISIYLDGKSYEAKIVNVNNPVERRKKDALQIRYTRNGDFSQALQAYFMKSYKYIKAIREAREKGDRTMIHLPDEYKEYLAIYTTEYDDSYVVEPIIADDMLSLKKVMDGQQERVMEAEFNYYVKDSAAGILETDRIVKIRKLNRKIGDNLKLLYAYRCQICGRMIGEEYGSHIVEAHHIDYFVSSLNNDANNQMIVCPNHHTIIHDVNPVFDRKRLLYIYKNGIEEKLVLNQHIK